MRVNNAPGPAARFIVAVAAMAVLLGACAGSTAPSTKSAQRGMPEDIGGVAEEKAFKEIAAVLPPYPQDSRLVEFKLRRNSANRFYVDRESISIGPDQVVRFSAVIKSPSDARSTSYEGMRCKTSEYRVYAYGVGHGEWMKPSDSQWRQIERSSIDFRFTLYKDYFCDLEAIAGRNANDLIYNIIGNPPDTVRQ